eukprot:1137520-Ditylum_brightwellii.AAC.1
MSLLKQHYQKQQQHFPVQISYMGSPGSSGAPYINYMIVDDMVSLHCAQDALLPIHDDSGELPRKIEPDNGEREDGYVNGIYDEIVCKDMISYKELMVSCALNKDGWYDHAGKQLILSREECLKKAQGCRSYLMQEHINAMNELGFSWTSKYCKVP